MKTFLNDARRQRDLLGFAVAGSSAASDHVLVYSLNVQPGQYALLDVKTARELAAEILLQCEEVEAYKTVPEGESG